MLYRWRSHTQSHPRGYEGEMDPSSPHTRDLLRMGIIEPASLPERETKVVAAPEVKKRRGRKAKSE